MRALSRIAAGSGVGLALACGFGDRAPKPVPEVVPPPAEIPVSTGPSAKFLALSAIPRGCRVDFADLTGGAVELLYPVAELPFGCEGLHIEADSSGRSLAFTNTLAPSPVVTVRSGVSSEVLLPGGARASAVAWEGTEIAVFSEVPIEPVPVDESGQSDLRRVDYGGQSYTTDFDGDVIGCVVHRPPTWEPTDFRVVTIGEGEVGPYCAKETDPSRFTGSWSVGIGRAGERTHRPPPEGVLVPGQGSGDALGQTVIAADPAGAWVWSSPFDDMGAAAGPLRVWVRGAEAWTHTDIPYTHQPTVRPPFVCGERGLILGMTGSTASAHAHVVWNSPTCARPWPDDLAAPPAWQGLAEAPPPVHVAPPPPETAIPPIEPSAAPEDPARVPAEPSAAPDRAPAVAP
jgi:hypothetical protein